FLLKAFENKPDNFQNFLKNFPQSKEKQINMIYDSINDEEKFYICVKNFISSINSNKNNE
ncbi:MAG: hypothetical protein ACPHVL_06855, partial [Psychroflexus salarius]